MKVFFDTNVYVAEALLGRGAEKMMRATLKGKWRIHVSQYVLDEVQKVLVEDLNFSRRLASLARRRILRRSSLSKAIDTSEVPADPKDSPILSGALTCGADYLVNNDKHLLALDPFHGLRVVSMEAYMRVLADAGHLQ